MNDDFIFSALEGADPALLEASFEYRRDVRPKFLCDVAAAALSVFLFAFVFNAECERAASPPKYPETAEISELAAVRESSVWNHIYVKEEE